MEFHDVTLSLNKFKNPLSTPLNTDAICLPYQASLKVLNRTLTERVLLFLV